MSAGGWRDGDGVPTAFSLARASGEGEAKVSGEYERRDVTHTDLILLTRYLASEGADGWAVARAVERPWEYLEELRQARLRDEDSFT
jgi:hypothetical protein